MAEIEVDRFLTITKAMFITFVDEYRGGYGGPFGLHPDDDPRTGPVPDPWLALKAAYQVASLADALELGQEGAGVGLMARFAEDPEQWCGTRWPGQPLHPKGGPPPIDPALLGAALVFVADGIGNETLAGTARQVGTSMIA
jgi:hypothetical protein